jgi:glycine/D-amino acid oxidase-like deaminating enzyme
MAIVGEAPGIKGLFLACGHSRTGATLSTLTGRVLSELIIDGRTDVDISVWDPARFEGKTFEDYDNDW